jgi:hypothetical protein
MFIKLTLQDSGHELFVNFDHAENFYRCGKGENVWTTVFMNNQRVYDCCETPEEISAQLAGGQK